MVETRTSLLFRVRDPADSVSWREFVVLYQPLLLAYVRRRGLSEHDAQDVVQEIFAKLVRVLPDFEFDQQRGRFRTWLWRLTHNAVVDWARRRDRRAAAEKIVRVDAEIAVGPEHAALEAEWLQAHRRRILSVVLVGVRAAANERTWRCFESHILQGRSSADVAQELGITTNSVYVNASRILARVREQCLEYEESIAGP
jgi:RNA polymerase sigma-70 factor (ECF subfamily)